MGGREGRREAVRRAVCNPVLGKPKPMGVPEQRWSDRGLSQAGLARPSTHHARSWAGSSTERMGLPKAVRQLPSLRRFSWGSSEPHTSIATPRRGDAST